MDLIRCQLTRLDQIHCSSCVKFYSLQDGMYSGTSLNLGNFNFFFKIKDLLFRVLQSTSINDFKVGT